MAICTRDTLTKVILNLLYGTNFLINVYMFRPTMAAIIGLDLNRPLLNTNNLYPNWACTSNRHSTILLFGRHIFSGLVLFQTVTKIEMHCNFAVHKLKPN